jgi:geranylgeranyl diphosphate synthase type II
MHAAPRELQGLIEAGLERYLPQCRRSGAKPLDDALRYAVFPGGKRLRPMMAFVGARIFGGDIEAALPAACAVEFIHTSSLIFDDLPCMDDAEIRRGRSVVHKVFGEEVALLAGIALLNGAYAIFGRVPSLIAEATDCIGVEGMIGGQALDLAPDAQSVAGSNLWEQQMAERNRKTSAMMRLALTAGALACGVPTGDVKALGVAGQRLGEAYQLGDDLLDVLKTSRETGKNAGQDLRHMRLSHGKLDEGAGLNQLKEMISEVRDGLTAAYGAQRVEELMGFVDGMFASMMRRTQ